MASPSKWVPVGASNSDPLIETKPKLTTIDIVGGIYCHICHSIFGNKKEFDSHYLKHGTGNTDFVYTCVVCHKEIVGYPSFRGHCYLAHVTKDKFKCEFCQKMFSKQCVLQTHIKNVHEAANKCTICQKQFQSQYEFHLHKITHKTSQDGPPYDCHVCGEVVENNDDCENHIEDHCSMFYSCPICNHDISDLQNAASHLTKHFGNVLKKENSDSQPSEIVEISNESSIDLVGGIFCCFCNDTYKTRNDFDNHFWAEHPDKDIVYSCNVCGKDFEKYFVLASHCYDHTAKDRFECEECHKTFPRLSILVIHMEAYHANIQTTKLPFTCLQCDHGFRTDRRLKEHYRIIHNIYYSQCPQQGCDKTFDAPKDLVLHLKDHNCANNWCKQCGLRFYSLEACEKHLQYHKTKLYSCPICSKKYGEKYLVTKHATQHFSAVLHVCKTCGKIYNSRNRLVQHMKVHNEIKPHNCTYCGKGFTKIYLLKQHLNVHTGLKPYKCTACPKSFASHPNLRKHLKNIHNLLKTESKLILNENNNQKSVNSIDLKDNLKDGCFNDNKVFEPVSLTNNVAQSNDMLVNSSAVDMSIDTNSTAHSFEESNESSSQWNFDNIDPIILELLEENIPVVEAEAKSIEEIHEELWITSPAVQSDISLHELVSESAAVVPPEYGPEFVGEGECAGPGDIRLDDVTLPHIDPRLTLLQSQSNSPNPCVIFTPPEPLWEPPIITKLDFSCYDFDATRMTVMNTDIY